ncbi:MAG TPA: hypothetical protein VFP35_04565 [Candidatus Saccharimonadales bacterium]|nr:hypothetical protein [Candidatus Saccharimonadales bacterium]
MDYEDLRQRYRHDYTGERINTAPPASSPTPIIPDVAELPQATTVGTQKVKVNKFSRLSAKLMVLSMAVLLLIAGAGFGAHYFLVKKSSPIPVNISRSVNFPLLYPAKLPAGYKIDPSSFSSANDVVLFSARTTSGQKIVFTVQKRPPTFDFGTFYQQGLASAAVFNTGAGQAAIGRANGQLIGSLATDQSWLIVSPSRGNISADSLRLILNSVKASH